MLKLTQETFGALDPDVIARSQILTENSTLWGRSTGDKQVDLLSWGGAYGKSHVEAYAKPFEAKTGMTMGPTQVMRMEHAQMRTLLDEARDALAAGNQDDYLGIAETLLIMMQQHNMKEENVLYPMCDQHLPGETPELLARLETELAES